MANRKKGDAGRAYARLTRHDRNQIEEMLKKRASCRQIAKAIGRAPSTVSNEVERHRVSVNVTFTIFTNVFSPIVPTRMRRIRQRGCAAFGA